MSGPADVLTGPRVAAAVQPAGWRVVLGGVAASVPVDSFAQAVEVAAAAARACGPDSDGHLRVDVRRDRVELLLETEQVGRATGLDVQLAQRVADALAGLGRGFAAATGAAPRPVQRLEIAIDALDIPAVLPFWRAVFGYVDEPGATGAAAPDAVVDPAGQGPAIWFQQMDEPRPQRNRIHFDLNVPDDDAEARIAAALAAGGRLVSDAEARAFWILADPEGNEVCICTWQDRESY